MKLIVPLAFVFVVAFSFTANAQKTFSSYGNSRFEYFVEYPADLLTPQPESDSQDGRLFTSADNSIEMRAWGSTNALSRSVDAEFKATADKETGITYRRSGPTWFAFSGLKDGKIFYRKTIYSKGSDSFASVLIEYSQAKKKEYDKMVQRIVKSLKFDK